jgi:hypothetical protein
MSGHRKAALALHAVSPDDRQAILRELPEEDQRLLRSYLEELEALGFDALAVEDALSARPATGPQAVIGAADPGTMASVLAAEPVSLIAALMRLESWPWAEDYLRGLPPARRLCVASLLAAPAAAAPARDALLLEQVAGAVRSAGSAADEPAPPSFVSSLVRRVTAWTR